jgi:hypothetical protein
MTGKRREIMLKAATVNLVLSAFLMGQIAAAQQPAVAVVTPEMVLIEKTADILDQAQIDHKTGKVDAFSLKRLGEARQEYIANAKYGRQVAVANMKQAALVMGVTLPDLDQAMKNAGSEKDFEAAVAKAIQKMEQPTGAQFSGLTVLKYVGVGVLAFLLWAGAAFGE